MARTLSLVPSVVIVTGSRGPVGAVSVHGGCVAGEAAAAQVGPGHSPCCCGQGVPCPPAPCGCPRVIPRPAFPGGRRVRSTSSGSGARPLALCPLPLVAAARVHGGAGGRSATTAPPGTCPHACSEQGPWRRAVLCEVIGGARGRPRHTLMPTRPPHLVKNDGSAHSLSTEPRRVAVRKQDCPGGDPQAGRESAALSPAP